MNIHIIYIYTININNKYIYSVYFIPIFDGYDSYGEYISTRI